MLQNPLEADAAWAVTAGARTTSAAVGEHPYAGVWPGSRARGRRVEAVLLAAKRRLVAVQGSSPPCSCSCSIENFLLRRHGHGGAVIHHVPLPLR